MVRKRNGCKKVRSRWSPRFSRRSYQAEAKEKVTDDFGKEAQLEES